METKTCSVCGKEKSLEAFEKHTSGTPRRTCRICRNRIDAARYQTAAWKEKRRAWEAQPHVKEKKAARDRKRAAVRAAARRASEKTVRGRILHCRRLARAKLKVADTPTRLRHYEGLIASYTKELDRIERLAS